MPSERSHKSTPARPFRVGDWLIEPALGQASRRDTTLRLRPQLVDLLEQLALRPNQTVSKDDLLDAVWADKYIAEAGVARCIAELRQLLGDDPRDPAFIQTVPKRGYRLVAPVSFVEEPAVAAPTHIAREEPRTAPALGLGRGLGPVPAAAGPLDDVPGARRRLRWPLLAVGAALTAAAAYLLAGPFLSGWRAQPHDRDLLVLAFDHTPRETALSDAVRIAVAVGLEESGRVRVMSDVQAGQLLAYMGRRSDEPITRVVGRELCERAGSPVVVAASVTALDRGYVISLEAEACGTGEALARAQAAVAGSGDLRQAAGRLAASVGARLQPALESTRNRPLGPLAAASTSSLPALRALSLGDAERVRGNAAEAIRLYLRAIDLDPQFATAYARLGSLQNVALTSIFPTSPAARPESDDRRKAEYLRTAFDLRDRVSEPERFHISALYSAWVQRDPAKALDTLESWKKLYPGTAIPLFEMARLHSAFVGDYETAISEAREALTLSPGDVVTLIALADAAIGANRLDEARAALEEASRRAPDLFGVHVWRYALAVLSRDHAAAEAEIRWSRRDQAIRMEFDRFEAQRAMAAGRLRDAAGRWRAILEWSAQRGYTTSVAGARANEALWRAWAGETRGVADAAREAVAASDHPLVQVEAGVALALAGEIGPARAVLQRIRAAYSGDNPMASQVLIPTLQGAIALQEGTPDKALELLRLAEPYELAKGFRLLPLALRSRASLAAGRWREAIAACEKLIAHRSVHPTTEFYSLAHRDLADALRRSGDSRRADETERRFRDLWREADSELLAARPH